MTLLGNDTTGNLPSELTNAGWSNTPQTAQFLSGLNSGLTNLSSGNVTLNDLSSWNNLLGSNNSLFGTSNNFDIPTNLYPSSSSSSQSSSVSGVDWNSPLVQALLPSIISNAQNLPSMAENMGDTLSGYYSNLMNQSMEPQAFQGTLNSLNSRGMLNSTVASDAISNMASNIARDIGNNAYQAKLDQYNKQMEIPQMLADIARLAIEQHSQSTSSSSYSNPLAPYQLYLQGLTY